MVPFVGRCQKHSSALRAAFVRQVCQSRSQGSLSRSVLIWAPSGRGRVILPGSCTLESLPGKKIPMKWSWEGAAWSEFTSALLWPPHLFQLELFRDSLTRNLDINPKYSMASCWHCPERLVQLQVKKLEQAFPVVSVSSWFYILTVWSETAARMAFGEAVSGSECSQSPWPPGQREGRVCAAQDPELGMPRGSSKDTENPTGEAQGISGI